MKKIGRKVFLLGLILVLCMSSILTTQAAKKIRSKSVSLETTKVTLSVGDVVTLRANMNPINSTDTLKWSSSNKNTATVNKYGVVTAVKEGSAIITVKTTSGKTAQCKVTIKKYLSSSEVKSLIEKQCLSKESVKKLIKANSLSEKDVVALIKQNGIDQETVRSIVAENALTEEKVKEIVEEKLNEASMDWEDGTELELYGDLPYQGEDGGVISDITIKKYHCTDTVDGAKQKYKYVVEFTGMMPDPKVTEEGTYEYSNLSLEVRYLNDSYDGGTYVYDTRYGRDTCLSYVEENGAFHAIFEQYGIYSDWDSFLISKLSFS